MNIVLQWLARQAVAFYLFALVGALLYTFAALANRRRLQAAQFSLEREITRQKMIRAWVIAGLFLLLGVMVFITSSYLVPTLPGLETPPPPLQAGLTPQPTATPTAPPTATPTLAPLVTEPAEEDANNAAPPEEVEPAPIETPTPTPTPLPPAEPPNCPSPDVQIIAPAAGSTLSGATGAVEVRGTARINAFAYYKFEVQFPGSNSSNFVAQFEQPVESGVLGYWDIGNPESYPAGGPYRFRLVTVDIYGNTQSCVIPVYISQP